MAKDAGFWTRWLRQPSLDVAESIIRLRRLRGFSQAKLAELIGSKQPAIARIETGRASISTNTLEKLAEALGATVRVEMQPVEMAQVGQVEAPWWERAVVPAPTHVFHSKVRHVQMTFAANADLELLKILEASLTASYTLADERDRGEPAPQEPVRGLALAS